MPWIIVAKPGISCVISLICANANTIEYVDKLGISWLCHSCCCNILGVLKCIWDWAGVILLRGSTAWSKWPIDHEQNLEIYLCYFHNLHMSCSEFENKMGQEEAVELSNYHVVPNKRACLNKRAPDF